jgi:hypothetical protein
MTRETEAPENAALAGDPIDRVIDDVFRQSRGHAAVPGMEFKAMLLGSYDELQRRRRNRLSLALFADAIGWRALSRPMAAAALLGSVCTAGFIAGVAGAPDDAGAYAELAAAFDQSFSLTEENDLWAEE